MLDSSWRTFHTRFGSSQSSVSLEITTITTLEITSVPDQGNVGHHTKKLTEKRDDLLIEYLLSLILWVFLFPRKLLVYIKKGTSTQVLTCEFRNILGRTYLCRKFARSCFWKCFFKSRKAFLKAGKAERRLLDFRGFNFHTLKKF